VRKTPTKTMDQLRNLRNTVDNVVANVQLMRSVRDATVITTVGKCSMRKTRSMLIYTMNAVKILMNVIVGDYLMVMVEELVKGINLLIMLNIVIMFLLVAITVMVGECVCRDRGGSRG
jgi:hypothetical protein